MLESLQATILRAVRNPESYRRAVEEFQDLRLRNGVFQFEWRLPVVEPTNTDPTLAAFYEPRQCEEQETHA